MIPENKEKLFRTIDCICRWAVGLVFLFSSFVKGVDPMGTAYKIEEYMTAWSIGSLSFEWAVPFATFLSVALVTLEFLTGIMLITNSFRKLTAWMLLLMMAFFTVTTLIDAITNKVTDCGCFGDAVKLTNWQTFWKNIALLVPTILIFHCRKMPKKKRTFERDVTIMFFSVVVMVVFAVYNINNEPVIDFRPWKVGNQMIPNSDAEMQSFVVYRNVKSGDTIEFEAKYLVDSMNSNPNWDSEWEWIDSRVIDPREVAAPGFSIMDMFGDDKTFEIIGHGDPIIIVTSHDILDINEKGWQAIQRVKSLGEEHAVPVVLLTASLPEQVDSLLWKNHLETWEYFFSDDKAIETIMRSNPGFLLMQEGVVKGKFHYRNYRELQNLDFEQL